MFYVRRGEKERGPFTAEQLKLLVGQEKIRRTDEVRKDGGTTWKPAAKVRGLFPETVEQSVQQPSKLAAVGKVAQRGGSQVIRGVQNLAKRRREAKPQVELIPQETIVPTRPQSSLQTTCGFCGELIQATAKKCRHCGEILDPVWRASAEAKAGSAAQPGVTNTTVVNVGHQRPRWSRGIAILLSLLIPGLGQLYKGQILNGMVWFVITLFGYVFILPGLILHFCCVVGAGMGDPYR